MNVSRVLESRWFWPTIVIAAVIALRAPMFGRWVVNTDESTFLVMGADVLRGNLPFLNLWDIKPPLTFWLAAAFSWAGGDTIIGVRFITALWVAAVALVCKVICDRMFGPAKLHWIPAFLAAVAITAHRSGGQMVSETLAILPFLGALALIFSPKPTLVTAFAAGLLLGAATMIRTNLGIPAAVLCFWMFAVGLLSRQHQVSLRAVFMGLGGAATLLLVMSPYVAAGAVGVFIQSVFVAPFSYSDAMDRGGLSSFVWRFLQNHATQPVLLLALIGIWSGRRAFRSANISGGSWALSPALIMIVALLAVLWSASFGPIYRHYFIQAAPLLAILAAPAFTSLADWPRRKAVAIASGVIAIYAVLGAAIATIDRGLFQPDTARAVHAALEEEMAPGERVLLNVEQIVYWSRGQSPIAPAPPHPQAVWMSNLIPFWSPEHTDAEGLLAAVFDQSPDWVVLIENDPRQYRGASVNETYFAAMGDDYVLRRTVMGRELYQRRESLAEPRAPL